MEGGKPQHEQTITWRVLHRHRKSLDYKRITVLGHSLGGRVAALAALRHPGRFERLICVDSVPARSGVGREMLGYMLAMNSVDFTGVKTVVDVSKLNRFF